ncbi:MAG: acyltransferase [Bacteroidia bacterium]|nr:acyltransferase [Bacteroidia bacterium]
MLRYKNFIKKIFSNQYNKTVLSVNDSSFQFNNEFITKSKSTIVKSDSSVRFDDKENLEHRKYLSIGEYGIINANFIFETNKGEIVIGDNVHIGGATFISRTKITVKDDVTMAWGITIYDHNSHSVFWEERKNDNKQCYHDYISFNGNNIVNKDWSNVISKEIIIESKVWIGFDVVILKGVKIGEGAVVGARSVVSKDVPAWTVVAGNPARVVKYLPNYKEL